MAGKALIGSVPHGWESMTLGEVIKRGGGSIQTGPFGSQLHASDYVPVGVPSIMPVNIGDNRLIEDGIARITEADAKRLIRHRVKTGDIIYSRRGDVERRAIIRKEHEGWLCGTGCLKLRFGDGAINSLFASYYLGHPDVRAWIVQHAVGATMPNLNTSIMEQIHFLLPPLKDQQAIACILGTLDDKIELNRRMNETLEAMARAIFKSWFVDFDPVRAKMDGRKPVGMDRAMAKLFPDEFEESELGLIPKGWRGGRIRDLCGRVENGGTPRREVEDYWYPQEIPWLTSGEVRQGFIVRTDNFISEEGLENSSAKIWPRFATIVALYGATAGYASLLGMELCANQACCALIPLNKASCFNYIAVFSSLRHFQQQTRGSAQQNLSQSIVADLPIIIPSHDILAAFEEQIQPLIFRCIHNLKESNTLAAIRDILLPKLLSGEIMVKKGAKLLKETV